MRGGQIEGDWRSIAGACADRARSANEDVAGDAREAQAHDGLGAERLDRKDFTVGVWIRSLDADVLGANRKNDVVRRLPAHNR